MKWSSVLEKLTNMDKIFLCVSSSNDIDISILSLVVTLINEETLIFALRIVLRSDIYEMFHILNCGVEIKWAMIIAVMNAI